MILERISQTAHIRGINMKFLPKKPLRIAIVKKQ